MRREETGRMEMKIKMVNLDWVGNADEILDMLSSFTSHANANGTIFMKIGPCVQ